MQAAIQQTNPVITNNQVTAQQPKIEEARYTVAQALDILGIKSRITFEKIAEECHVTPIRKRGVQPENYRGRKFFYRESAILKILAYMERRNGRVKVNPEDARAKLGIKPAEAKAAIKSVEAPKKRKSIAKKADIIAMLDQALERVQYLTTVVEAISKDHQKALTGSDTTH